MSQTGKVILGVVVVIIIVLIGWWVLAHPGGQGSSSPGAATTTSDSTTLPSGSDTSDTGINQDLQSINANLNASASDQSAVNDSVNQAAQ